MKLQDHGIYKALQNQWHKSWSLNNLYKYSLNKSGISAIVFQMEQDMNSSFVRVFPPFHLPSLGNQVFYQYGKSGCVCQNRLWLEILFWQNRKYSMLCSEKLYKAKCRFAFPDDRRVIFWTALFNKLLVLLLLWISSWSFSEARAVSNALCPSVWRFLGRRPQKTDTLVLGFE